MSKKEEILEAALKLFSTEGYENVGIQKIVETAGVKKPTLYHYFGSKQGLLNSLINYYYTPFLVTLENKSEYSGDIIKSLEAVVKHHFEFAVNNQSIYQLTLSLVYSSKQSEARKTVLPYIEQQFKTVKEIFLDAEKDHGNMKGRSYNFTTTFLGMITSWITNYYTVQSFDLDDKVVYESCRQFMYGIFS